MPKQLQNLVSGHKMAEEFSSSDEEDEQKSEKTKRNY